jgi:hypothetical protein
LIFYDRKELELWSYLLSLKRSKEHIITNLLSRDKTWLLYGFLFNCLIKILFYVKSSSKYSFSLYFTNIYCLLINTHLWHLLVAFILAFTCCQLFWCATLFNLLHLLLYLYHCNICIWLLRWCVIYPSLFVSLVIHIVLYFVYSHI